MDNAHLEDQSQNRFSIKSSESKIDWSNLYKIKLIMRQPSPNWKKFSINDVKVIESVEHGKMHRV